MKPNPTTGLNTAARVVITSSAPTLVLVGATQLLTYQLSASVTDVDGNVLGTQPQLYYDIVAGTDVANVSHTGLVTATGLAAGQCVVQVACAAFGATPGAYTPSGIPATGVVYAEQTIQVTPGVQILPDFSFTLDANSYTVSANGTFSITITQTALHGFIGSVAYTFYTSRPIYPGQAGYGVGQPLPTVSFMFYTPYGGIPVTVAGNTSGTITGGSGTLTLNFTAQDAPAGTVPFVISGLYPTWGTTGAAAGGPIRAHNVSAQLVVTA
jgi:hypothetical protein